MAARPGVPSTGLVPLATADDTAMRPETALAHPLLVANKTGETGPLVRVVGVRPVPRAFPRILVVGGAVAGATYQTRPPGDTTGLRPARVTLLPVHLALAGGGRLLRSLDVGRETVGRPRPAALVGPYSPRTRRPFAVGLTTLDDILATHALGVVAGPTKATPSAFLHGPYTVFQDTRRPATPHTTPTPARPPL